MTDWDILNQAHQALKSAVSGVADSAWQRPTPCAEWIVVQVLQHAAGDQLGYASLITGEPGPTENPFAPSGKLDADTTPRSVAQHAMDASARAWSTVGPDVQDAPTPLPQGRLPAWLGVGACALDAAVHAWDIAVATGQPSPLSQDLARALLSVATSIVEPLRPYRAYAPALDPHPDDGDVAQLLRYLGRRPDWAA